MGITESKPDNILNKSEKVKATWGEDQGNNNGKKKDIKKSNDETSKNQKSVNKVSKSKSRTSQSMGKKSINSSGVDGSVKKKIKVSKASVEADEKPSVVTEDECIKEPKSKKLKLGSKEEVKAKAIKSKRKKIVK